MANDKLMEKHRHNAYGSGYLPTPHGRAIAPWRELEEMPRRDSRMPAEDYFFSHHFDFDD